MSVVLDNAGTFASSAAAATTQAYTGLTVGSGTNRFMLAYGIFFTTISSPTATWDAAGANQSMAYLGAAVSGAVTIQWFSLVNPVAGNKTLTFNWVTSNSNRGFFASSWTGVNQSVPLYSSVAGNGSSVTPTYTATSVLTGDVATAVLNGAGVQGMNSVSNTQLGLNTGFGFGANYANGAGANITLTGTLAGSSAWVAVGTAISAAAAGAPAQRSPFVNAAPTVMMCPNFARPIERATSKSIIVKVPELVLPKRRLWVPKPRSRPAPFLSLQ
jgi:hypothetical protein